MKEKILIIFIFLLLFSACKKQIEKERPEFIGRWYSSIDHYYPVYLDIDENSYAVYTVNWDGDNKNTFKGNARANDNTLNIGRLHYFKIIEYPKQIDTSIEKKCIYDEMTGKMKLANWKMILRGIHPSWFIPSGSWTYYKFDY
jgi:hypothetical protein